jgi:hypothetical protein
MSLDVVYSTFESEKIAHLEQLAQSKKKETPHKKTTTRARNSMLRQQKHCFQHILDNIQ